MATFLIVLKNNLPIATVADVRERVREVQSPLSDLTLFEAEILTSTGSYITF